MIWLRFTIFSSNFNVFGLLYRQAANAGYALAAIRLGATYDPAEFSRLRVEGLTPDAVEARKWYERARELGAPEADEHLARLSGY